MIHRSRVSGWLPVLATLLVMFMVSTAAAAYYGAIEDDPNAWPLVILAAFGCGAPAWLILYAGWQGVTLNIGNCPAAGGMLPQAERWYPEIDEPRQFQEVTAVYHAPDGMNWMLNYPIEIWRSAKTVIDANGGRFPQRQAEAATPKISRPQWDRLKLDLITAGLAAPIRQNKPLFITDNGRRLIDEMARKRI